jgi:micrococcal nuclease
VLLQISHEARIGCGRTVGVVQVGGINVNEEIIRAGYAWQYRKYCKEGFCDDWLKVEGKARNAKVGLWGDSDPVAPWDWRKGARNSNFTESTNHRHATATGGYHGNTKSHVFHSPICRHYNCRNCNQVFSTKSAALNSGYRPCGGCKP